MVVVIVVVIYLHSRCDESSGQFLMVDPMSYFLIQPVLYNWSNKARGVIMSVGWFLYNMFDAI